MRKHVFASGFGFLFSLSALAFVACQDPPGGGDDDDDDQTGGTAGSLGGGAGSGMSGSAGTGTNGGGGAGGAPPSGGSAGVVGLGGAGGLAGAAGSGGGGGMPPIGDISWDATGYIDKGLNTFGVNGSWFSYNDCADAMRQMVPCTMPDSALIGPDNAMGWATTNAQVCMKGTAAQVIAPPDGGVPDGGIDYFGIQWGAGIAFDLNNAGAGATAMPFDATAAGISGFIFDLTGSAPMTVRINFVMPTTESTSHFIEVLPTPNTQVDFLAVNQGSWVTGDARVVFDPTMLRTIQFQVFTNSMAPTPYDFCVSNVRVLRPM